MQNINWQLTLINTFAANFGIFLILFFLWIAAVHFSAWHCLNKLNGIDRLTWLIVIIGIPYLGIAFYWLKGADENPNAKAYKGVDAL